MSSFLKQKFVKQGKKMAPIRKTMMGVQLRSGASELNVDNWNDNCEAKSEGKSPRPLRGLQVDFSLTRNVSYAVCR